MRRYLCASRVFAHINSASILCNSDHWAPVASLVLAGGVQDSPSPHGVPGAGGAALALTRWRPVFAHGLAARLTSPEDCQWSWGQLLRWMREMSPDWVLGTPRLLTVTT